MFVSLRVKLFATLLAAVLVVIIGMFFWVHWSFDRGFLKYINTLELKRLDALALHLQDAYVEQEDWSFLQGNLRLWRQFLAATTPEGYQQFDPLEGRGSQRMGKNRRDFLNDVNQVQRSGTHRGRSRRELQHLFEFRVVLMDADKNVVVGPRRLPPDIVTIPLTSHSATIGYLGHFPQKDYLAQHQLHFAQKQKKSFAVISFLIATLAALISFPLAGRMVKRINALAIATDKLAKGEYQSRLDIGSKDELGQLTRDFNFLALTLEQNEQLRKQMVADISHELRTPLAVLRGEIEALQDGVRPNTPEAIGSLHAEVMRLNRLVDDLFQLSLSDIGALTYKKEKVDLNEIVHRAVNLFAAEFADKDISLELEAGFENEISLLADTERLQQLFGNLLSNSLKYTESGGKLYVHYKMEGKTTVIYFEDSGPGVLEKDLPRLFDRLYRVETSRSRSSGGAGLGLAICKKIVEAHGGTIVAGNSQLGGVSIRITLPSGELP